MTDSGIPADGNPHAPEASSRSGLFIGLGIGGGIVFAAIVAVVLMVTLNVLGSTNLAAAAAKRALLNSSDLASVAGVEVATGPNSNVEEHTLQSYVTKNPGDTSNTVSPAQCADNLEGWMAWKSLDTPTYRGWKTDVIFEAANIVVHSTSAYQNGIQQARRFATAAAAAAFMQAERGWYSYCAHTTYTDPADPSNVVTYAFSPISLNLGLDAVVERSNDQGTDLPPHLIDVYLRKQNIVYVTELVTRSAPRGTLDHVSLEIVKAAAKKIGSLN